jgi:hypothetical protein
MRPARGSSKRVRCRIIIIDGIVCCRTVNRIVHVHVIAHLIGSQHRVWVCTLRRSCHMTRFVGFLQIVTLRFQFSANGVPNSVV